MTVAELSRSGPVNLRDLGGTAVKGGVLREGVAIRTDDLSLVTEEFAEQMVANGLRSIIDLRSIDEVRVTGRGPLGEQRVAYHHIPLMGRISESVDRNVPLLTHESMGAMYIGLVENAASELVTALNIIAYSPGATAFHCAAGRDRTGVLAAMYLLAVGADDADIVTDYALTGANMPRIMERTRHIMRPIMQRLGFNHEEMHRGSTLADPGMEISMQLMLEHLRETYGDPLTPLRVAGLSEGTVAALRRKALTA